MVANRRSDIVRARRDQRSSTSSKPRKDRKDRKRKKSRSRNVPPMVSRAGMVYTTAVSSKTRKKTRKRYNVSLDSAGAEVKLPAVPVVSVGWRVLSGVMVAGLLFALYWLWTAPMFTVETVTLNGLGRVDQVELLAKADVLNKPVFLIDPQELQSSLQNSIRALEEMTVMVNFPAEVIFEAVERQPVIVWEQAGVTSWWVDDTGARFAPLGSSEGLVYVEAKAPPPPLPSQEVEGEEAEESDGKKPESEQLLPPGMVSAILFLADYLPEGAPLIYHEEYGIGWEDPEMEWKVFFGKKLDQMPVRISLYQAILADLEEKNRRPVLISIEQVKAPYYRMRN
jgi:hypothetical protein